MTSLSTGERDLQRLLAGLSPRVTNHLPIAEPLPEHPALRVGDPVEPLLQQGAFLGGEHVSVREMGAQGDCRAD